MPTTHYEFELKAIDVDASLAPKFNNVLELYSVSDSDLDDSKQKLHGEALTFDCYPYQVDARLRTKAEALLAALDPPVACGEIIVFPSRPTSGGTTWSPTSAKILHLSEDGSTNCCASVTGTPGNRIWRQVAFEAVQNVP